jgi:hypothetical protein
MRPVITVQVGGTGRKGLENSFSLLTHKSVLVGVPTTTASDRQAQILKAMVAVRGKKRKARMAKTAAGMINNAQLVFIHTNGSPARGIPARPIIEAAITDKQNNDLICAELEGAAAAAMDGNPDLTSKQLKRAALLAETLVKGWFTNPRNHWAPNKQSTIKRKGSSRPLIDTSSMRNAIRGLVVEE